MPPPVVAELPEMVLLATVNVPASSLRMPPPSAALPPEMVIPLRLAATSIPTWNTPTAWPPTDRDQGRPRSFDHDRSGGRAQHQSTGQGDRLRTGEDGGIEHDQAAPRFVLVSAWSTQ